MAQDRNLTLPLLTPGQGLGAQLDGILSTAGPALEIPEGFPYKGSSTAAVLGTEMSPGIEMSPVQAAGEHTEPLVSGTTSTDTSPARA